MHKEIVDSNVRMLEEIVDSNVRMLERNWDERMDVVVGSSFVFMILKKMNKKLSFCFSKNLRLVNVNIIIK